MADATLTVRVTPRAARAGVVRVADGVVFLRVTAPPVEGAANAATIALLAEALGVSRSRVVLRSGASGRLKRVTIEGVAAVDALACLARAAGAR